jgi:N-formylglutamate deformylase
VPPTRPGAVVVNVPHAGEAVPDGITPPPALPSEVLRRDVDLGVERLCANAPRLGAGLLYTHVSRFVVDLNRHPDDVAAAVELPPARRPPVSYGPRGLVWLETTRGEVVLPRKLSPDELDARLAYYHPYHQALAQLLAERKRRHGFAVLLDAHSMPSLGATGQCDAGVSRADIVLGDNLGKACSPELVARVEDVCARAGLSVVRNRPYRGGYDTRYYGRPEKGVHALQIEINRKLYMDEDALRYLPQRAVRVQAVMDDVVEVAVGWKP